mmetsp:Transcript_111063/g.358566  ORF Transcript_111063/g.358566 Transcript_111063/m.358566 type:complete len:243 (-) Transcript_111063:1280-2008(-)
MGQYVIGAHTGSDGLDQLPIPSSLQAASAKRYCAPGSNVSESKRALYLALWQGALEDRCSVPRLDLHLTGDPSAASMANSRCTSLTPPLLWSHALPVPLAPGPRMPILNDMSGRPPPLRLPTHVNSTVWPPSTSTTAGGSCGAGGTDAGTKTEAAACPGPLARTPLEAPREKQYVQFGLTATVHSHREPHAAPPSVPTTSLAGTVQSTRRSGPGPSASELSDDFSQALWSHTSPVLSTAYTR